MREAARRKNCSWPYERTGVVNQNLGLPSARRETSPSVLTLNLRDDDGEAHSIP